MLRLILNIYLLHICLNILLFVLLSGRYLFTIYFLLSSREYPWNDSVLILDPMSHVRFVHARFLCLCQSSQWRHHKFHTVLKMHFMLASTTFHIQKLWEVMMILFHYITPQISDIVCCYWICVYMCQVEN